MPIAMGFRIRKGSEKIYIYMIQIRQSHFLWFCISFAYICQLLKNKGGAYFNVNCEAKGGSDSE